MKKTLKVLAIITMMAVIVLAAGCKSTPENPNAGPVVNATIPELFSPDPDNTNERMTVAISVEHPVPIKDWTIQIQPNRQGAGQRQSAEGGQRQSAEGGQRERPEGQERQRRRAAFFEQTGNGKPPANFQWNGRGTSGELVQSATEYRLTIAVNDIFDNSTTYEGIINIDVIVRQEGDVLRIIVPSIVFPANSSDFARLTEDERRSNTRILRLIANALNRYPDYRITVEGHANPTTAPDTPERTREEAGAAGIIGLRPLSEQRARAVADFLVANNDIARTRLNAVGVGGTRTVADYDDEDENWKNRRVEFILNR